MHHDGYGFVVPDVPMPQLDGDIFIPRDAVEDAMHGDRVVARLQRVSDSRGRDFRVAGSRGGQRAEGRIVRVLGRAHPSVVGLFRYGPRGNVVLPYDVRMQHQIEIPPGDELTAALREKLGLGGDAKRKRRARQTFAAVARAGRRGGERGVASLSARGSGADRTRD